MRKLERYLGIVLLVLLTGMVCSCGKEEVSNPETSEKVNLNLQLLGISRTTNQGTEFDNLIKTLRILITDVEGNILVNGMLENLTSNTVRIMGVPRTQIRIYAFANEASMGRNLDTASLLADIDQNDYIHTGPPEIPGKGDGKLEPAEILARAWDDTQNTYFPLTVSDAVRKGLGLPMTGHLGVADNTTYHDGGEPIDLNGDQTEYSIEIYLVRSVVKVVVNLTNNTGSEINLSQIGFGRFFADKVYYYSHENDGQETGPMPFDTALDFKIFDVSEILESKTDVSKEVLVYYMYPSATDNNTEYYRYSIALDGTGNFPKSAYKEFYKTEGARTVLWRNSIMEINGTINPGSISVTSTISVEIEDWQKKEDMDIEFN